MESKDRPGEIGMFDVNFEFEHFPPASQQEGNGERLAISAWYNFTWAGCLGLGLVVVVCLHGAMLSLPPSLPSISCNTYILRTSVTNDVQM